MKSNETRISIYVQVLDENNMARHDMIKIVRGEVTAFNIDCAVLKNINNTIYDDIYLCLSVYLSVCLSVCLSLSVFLSVCLSVCLCVLCRVWCSLRWSSRG